MKIVRAILVALCAVLGIFAVVEQAIAAKKPDTRAIQWDSYFDSNPHVQPLIPQDLKPARGAHSWKAIRPIGHINKLRYELYYSQSQDLHYVVGSGEARETVQFHGKVLGGIMELQRETAPGSGKYEVVGRWDRTPGNGDLYVLNADGSSAGNVASNQQPANTQQQPSSGQPPAVATEKPPTSTANNECRLLSGFAKTLCEKAAAVGVVGR